jgi:hypothetical protein
MASTGLLAPAALAFLSDDGVRQHSSASLLLKLGVPSDLALWLESMTVQFHNLYVLIKWYHTKHRESYVAELWTKLV